SGTNTTTDATALDGINLVRFDNGNELNASTLGVCASYYSGCSSSGTLKWYVSELDVTFNDDFNSVWHYGGGTIASNHYDFRSVALHEMGHGHQMGHVINSSSVMHYALSNGQQNAMLSANEIAGGNYQMNLSTTESRCGQPVMVATNCNTAPVANFTASPNVTCSGNGNTIQFNNTSTFNPTTYAWDVNGDNVTDYTSASPSHTYPSGGLYTVTLTVSNAVGSDTKTISVYVGGSFTPIGCSPTTTNLGNYGTGINTFEFNTIVYSNTSNNNDGLLDLICAENTLVNSGQSIPFSVILDGGNPEYCKIWIDYNNDGSFNNTNELVYNGTPATSHSGTISIPSTATQGAILRLRVISDFNTIANACSDVSYGEINDFGVYISCTGAPSPTVASLPNATGECSVSNVAAPTATDACTGGTITGTTSDPTSYSAQGTYTITWTYTGTNGATSTQTQTVVVDDISAPVPNQASLAAITASCEVTSLTAPTATDNCSGSVTGTHNVSLPITTQGTTVVTWTYTDAEGNSATQTQNVVINDNTAPVPNQTNLTDISAACEVNSLTAPTAIDNCSGTVTGTHNASLPITAQGTMVVTWTYTDAAGNSSTQNQNVIINDNQAPVPTQASLSDISAACEVNSLTAPTANDNCSGTVTGTHNASLPITAQGTTVVTWTYTDAAGNSSTQTQNVVINDNLAPQVSNCPGNMTLTPNAANCAAVVTWSGPSASDNCGSVTTSSTHSSGDVFPLGVTTVTYTFSDDAGNQATCSFDITVQADLNMSAIVSPETNGSDGSIDLTVVGGSPVYTFDWDNDGTGDFDDTEDLTGLTLGTYTVVIKDGNDCTRDSSFTIDSHVGLSTSKLGYLKVYPNPSSKLVTISRGKNTGELTIKLTNSLGQKLGLYNMTGMDKSISIEEFAAGVYFFEISQGDVNTLIRIVKE
ncbi:MAG: HYR domain-containing protein, partial [Crocinitomicaceae bacterium]|nr:HYR domain-containing protein [Crocinitomicaceae bacterium]